MIIHGSKSKLKRLRYRENCEQRISTLLEVITFDPTVGILISLVFCKLNIQIFPRKPRSPQSESEKTSKCTSKGKTKKVHEDEIVDVSGARPDAPTRATGAPVGASGPKKHVKAYKRLLAAQIEGETFWEHLSRHFFSLHISLPKNTKTHQNFLIILFSPKIQGSVHTLHLPLLGSIPWIWGIGVWM